MAEIMYTVGSILILPAIIFAMVAQYRVTSAFDKFSQIPCKRGITAAELASELLSQNGCSHVLVEKTPGHLTDHYDPRKKTVALSDSVYESTSLAALGIAAHEVGHAIQDHTKYFPLKLRQVVIKSTSLINKMLMPLIIIGLLASLFITGATIFGIASADFFLYLTIGFCAIYAISFIINLITLPTEYDASRRAKHMLSESSTVRDQEDQEAINRVLGAAALTYVAGLVVSLAYLLRFLGLVLMLFDRRR